MLLNVCRTWRRGALEIYLGAIGCDAVLSEIGSTTLTISSLCSSPEVKYNFRSCVVTCGESSLKIRAKILNAVVWGLFKFMGTPGCGFCKAWMRY